MDDLFPELIAENGGFRIHILEIPDIITPFTQIRYKTATKMIPIGAFWTSDRLPDGGELVENEKNPLFEARNEYYSRRQPT